MLRFSHWGQFNIMSIYQNNSNWWTGDHSYLFGGHQQSLTTCQFWFYLTYFPFRATQIWPCMIISKFEVNSHVWTLYISIVAPMSVLTWVGRDKVVCIELGVLEGTLPPPYYISLLSHHILVTCDWTVYWRLSYIYIFRWSYWCPFFPFRKLFSGLFF